MEKAVKEITIMLLICLIAMLILAVVLYKYVPSRKVVPEVTTYAADEQTQDLLSDPIDQNGTASDVILTYEVTEKDLGGYKGTQDYIPGKANPFAPSSGEVTEENPSNPIKINTDNSSNSGSSSNSSSSSKSNNNEGIK